MNPNLPVGGSASDVELGVTGLPEDVTQLALVMQYGHFSRNFDGHEEVFEPDDPLLQSIMGTLIARHHFGAGWAAELSVPMGLVQVSTHAPSGELDQGLALRNGEVDHSTSRIGGFGDVRLGGRYDLAGLWGVGGYKPSLTVGMALALPTAEQATVSPEPTVPPTLLALGAGSWAVSPRMTYTQFVHADVAIAVPLSLRVPLSRAETGRRAGTAFDAQATLLYQPADALTLRGGLGYTAVGYADEELEGTILNSGGSWIRAVAGASVRLGDRAVVGAGVRVPFYADVHGRQLSETFTVDATVGLVFGAGEETEDDGHDHDHDHEGGHEEGPAGAEHTTGDVADVATGGESFSLEQAAVPGKITVVDFWATWCHPCEHVEDTLDVLVAEHPDLAVRRAEIIDFDQPIGQEHFGGEGKLPHLWIIGPDGRLIERFSTTSPDEVEARVLDHLRKRQTDER